ncbi:hypothetical protein CCR75_001051 [Bremia lactucae]|uniref:Potassium channel tetramerisation-type BTB domain-containing protein n=1 Tax=Bremia lactucae TaxID=4779 RepID=A0A976NXS2_BRELC|nr:hypothetical protein CCR75_001051 [Bremia lactucae]
MICPQDDEELHDAHVVTNYDDLLDDVVTKGSLNDDRLTISVDWSDDSIELRRNQAERVSSRHTEGRMATGASTMIADGTCVPILLRASSQGAYFDFRSLDPDHTVGRTRVPWHSKSISDIRDLSPPRVVAFDVSGKLFRCKESLIAKYPLKRLNQIITCKCGKITCLDDAFYIDRNPQHFEMILDWYRTGKLVRQRNVNEEAFKNDAIYFDLYDEMFPCTPTSDAIQTFTTTEAVFPLLSVRRRSVNDVELARTTPKRVSMFATMASVPQQPSQRKQSEQESEKMINAPDVQLPSTTTDGPERFIRRERRILTPSSLPLIFLMRSCEHLLVEKVTGRGKLLVRVCDATGLRQVHVAQAILFDSQSRCDRFGNGTQIQPYALLPGDHVYTFWMAEHTRGTAAGHPVLSPMLDIEFKLVYTFDSGDKMSFTLEKAFAHTLKTSMDTIPSLAIGEKVLSETDSSVACLFMPPSKISSENSALLEVAGKSPSHATKKVTPFATANGEKRAPQIHKNKASIRHAGALIMRSGHYLVPQLNDQCPATLRGLHHLEAKNQVVEATYHEMPPRLFG